MRVVIGSDKGGMKLKGVIKAYLLEQGHSVVDLSEEPAADCCDSAVAVAHDVLAHEGTRGIAFDAYGAGSFMAAGNVKGAIVAEISDERSAYMTRQHNNANMLALGSEILGDELARNIVKEFLAADYDGGRHQVRVDMLNKMA